MALPSGWRPPAAPRSLAAQPVAECASPLRDRDSLRPPVPFAGDTRTRAAPRRNMHSVTRALISFVVGRAAFPTSCVAGRASRPAPSSFNIAITHVPVRPATADTSREGSSLGRAAAGVRRIGPNGSSSRAAITPLTRLRARTPGITSPRDGRLLRGPVRAVTKGRVVTEAPPLRCPRSIFWGMGAPPSSATGELAALP